MRIDPSSSPAGEPGQSGAVPAADIEIRAGGPEDAAILVDMFDDAVAWLGSRGWTQQWGTEPFSSVPKRVERCQTWAASGGLWIATRNDEPIACLVLGDAHDYVPPATEPELYVQVLVGYRHSQARGGGARLLAHARSQARRAGVTQLRVDCYAGNDDSLVQYYQRHGFVRSGSFTVGDWQGAILVDRLTDEESG